MIRHLILAAALLSAPAVAAGFQDTVALAGGGAYFRGVAAGHPGGGGTRVFAGLKLAQCPTVSLAWRTPAQDAVVVRCSGPEWRIFVPVLMPAGAAPIPMAGPAAAPAIAQPPIIRRNDPVTIEAGSDGFSIAREGIAMGDAAPGARFMVRVDGAKGPVQATAVAPGRATLPGWGE